MRLKLMTVALAVVVVGESTFLLLRQHPTNRFKFIEGYDGMVAFDTASGQLCKTAVTKSPAEIAQQVKDDFAKEQAESARRAEVDREKATRTHDWADRAVAEMEAQPAQLSKDASAGIFVAALPACKDIR